MSTSFAVSPDGTPIAYDRYGSGPAILLIHGGGGNRGEWSEAGYVNRLKDEFTVISMDLRGHGESGLPINPSDYTTEKMVEDFLAVADACKAKNFSVWAMSYGAKIARYLGVQSERLEKLVLMSTQLGLGVSGKLRQDAVDFCEHWPPILLAQREGTLNPDTLSENDQHLLQHLNVPVMLGWVRAMLDWHSVTPTDLLCPTLWMIGSQDEHGMTSLHEFEADIPESKLKVQVMEGMDHEQVFEKIDEVLPILLAFTKS